MTDAQLLQRKIAFTERLAEAWNEGGITWAVCNGLSGYPDDIGRDLDVVTASADLEKAREITIRTMEQEGFAAIPFRLGWVLWTLGIRRHEGRIECVQIDLFDHLQWASCWVVDGVGRFGGLTQRGPFRIDPAATAGKRLLLNVLSGDLSVFAKKPQYLELDQGEREILPGLVEHLTGSSQPKMVEALLSGDLKRIGDEAGAYRKLALRRSVLPGDKWFSKIRGVFQKQWDFNLSPKCATPIVAIQALSKDIEEKIVAGLVERTSKHLVFHDNPIMVNRPQYRSKGEKVGSAWKALLDYRLGGRLKARRYSALMCFPFFEGHALSLHLDPQREGLEKFPRWMARLAPRPGLSVFIENGDADCEALRNSGCADLADEVVNYRGVEETCDRVFELVVANLEELARNRR